MSDVQPVHAIMGVNIDIEATDIVTALNSNDIAIRNFIVQVLDAAGSSELEEMLTEELKQRWIEGRGGLMEHEKKLTGDL